MGTSYMLHGAHIFMQEKHSKKINCVFFFKWDQLWYLPPENGRLKAASTSSILVSPEAKAR